MSVDTQSSVEWKVCAA